LATQFNRAVGQIDRINLHKGSLGRHAVIDVGDFDGWMKAEGHGSPLWRLNCHLIARKSDCSRAVFDPHRSTHHKF
jgi:hypothetical protein